MVTTSFNVQNEGVSTSRPSFFDGNDYAYWKVRMIIYLQSINYDLWISIENRPHKPTKIENNIMVLKPRSEYTNGDKKLLSMEAKTMNTLCCALSINEFNRTTSSKNARDIWHALEITHKRTNQVNE
jgi:hypothetical protein